MTREAERMPGPVESLLERARKRITPVGAWTQYYQARDASGGCTQATSPAAVCWCAAGALWAERGEDEHVAFNILDEAKPSTVPVTFYNDRPERTQSDILEWYDRAIALARERGL
jgi:hypothetical protein